MGPLKKEQYKMKLFREFVRITQYVAEKTALILVIIMILNIWAAVLFRYVLHASLFWSEELGRYMMIWFGYLGCALAIRENSHVNLTFFTNIFPSIIRKYIAVFSNLIISAFVIVVFLKSIKYFQNLKGQLSSSLQIPMVIPYLAITVGMALMLIMNVSNMTDLILDIRGAGHEQPKKEEK
jgi:C4-dicarboxylate transporter DctQ subunit